MPRLSLREGKKPAEGSDRGLLGSIGVHVQIMRGFEVEWSGGGRVGETGDCETDEGRDEGVPYDAPFAFVF